MTRHAQQPTIIKKYANRRLYNTGTSTYVTLDDLAKMVKAEEDFIVVDAKTQDDITRSVLTQIIVEQEGRGGQMLPTNFLRQLIRFYGDSMQTLVPSYLDFSMNSFAKDQEKFREQLTKSFGATAMGAMENQVRSNMAMFERAFRMFTPFSPDGEAPAARGGAAAPSGSGSGGETTDLDALRQQLADVQSRLDQLARKK